MRWPFFMKQPAALVEAYRKIDKLTTDKAYWETRALTAGKLSNELMRERDEARALLANAYVRGPKGHFQRAELPEVKGSNA